MQASVIVLEANFWWSRRRPRREMNLGLWWPIAASGPQAYPSTYFDLCQEPYERNRSYFLSLVSTGACLISSLEIHHGLEPS